MHVTPREGLALGLRVIRVRSFNFSSHRPSDVVGDVKERVAAAELSHAPGGFCHHPQAVRMRTRTDGRRQKRPCRFGDVYSNRSGLTLPTPNTLPGTSRLSQIGRRACHGARAALGVCLLVWHSTRAHLGGGGVNGEDEGAATV